VKAWVFSSSSCFISTARAGAAGAAAGRREEKILGNGESKYVPGTQKERKEKNFFFFFKFQEAAHVAIMT